MYSFINVELCMTWSFNSYMIPYKHLLLFYKIVFYVGHNIGITWHSRARSTEANTIRIIQWPLCYMQLTAVILISVIRTLCLIFFFVILLLHCSVSRKADYVSIVCGCVISLNRPYSVCGWGGWVVCVCGRGVYMIWVGVNWCAPYE